MDIVKVFGTNVKHYRQALGISQEAFAEKCRASQNIYQRNRVLSQKYFP